MSIKNTTYYQSLRNFLQQIRLWETSISLYIVLKILWQKIIRFDIDQRAAAVSFSFMLAVFPGVIFLFTLIPYIPILHLDRQIMGFLKEVMPKGLYQTSARTIYDIISRQRGDILSFGFLFSVFAATNGMTALMRAFNMTLKTREKRTYFKARLIGFLLTILLIILQVASVVILILGRIAIDFLGNRDWRAFKNKINLNFLKDDFNFWLLQIFRYGSIFFIFYIGICIIYFFGPAVSKRFRFFNLGSLIASILCILATNLFSFYISNFNSYNKLYGSIGTLIALMIWVYLISVILIFGFEINTSLREALTEEAIKEQTPHQTSGGGV
jgi:membrane protein